SARVFSSLTIAENLVAAAHLAPDRQQAEAEVALLLDRLHLGEVADRLPDQLPFGSLRRLEVGLALASRPTLLLLDEPGAGMDEEDLDRLAQLIDRVRAEDGVALFLVEHDVALVGRMADRVIVLDQ